jgi:hypothetical protein
MAFNSNKLMPLSVFVENIACADQTGSGRRWRRSPWLVARNPKTKNPNPTPNENNERPTQD